MVLEFSKNPAVVHEIDTNSNIIYYVEDGKFCAKAL